jgi:hypothetical protein
MSSAKRIEQLTSARSLNDVLEVVRSIGYEFHNSRAITNRLISKMCTSAEITFDHTGGTGHKKGVVDKGFKVPDMAQVAKHADVLNKMHDNVIELDHAQALIRQSFVGNKKLPAALKAIQELKADVEAKVSDALGALQDIAEKHIPREMDSLKDRIVGHLTKTLDPKAYEQLGTETYVAPTDEANALLEISVYVSINKLRTIEGYVYDEYYFVLTAVIDKDGEMVYWLNGLPSFKLPGQYPLGKVVGSAVEARNRVDMLLAHNDILVQMEKLELPINKQRARGLIGTIPNVRTVDVKDGELVLTLTSKTTTAQTHELVKSVMAVLGAVVNNRNKNIFQYREGRSDDGKSKTVTFVLVPNVEKKDKAMTFNVAKLQDASEILGLTSKQKDALRFALQH